MPVEITFVVSLHVDSNDGGLWAFQMGRPPDYDANLGYATMDGQTCSNCEVQPVSGLCQFEYFIDSAMTVVLGGANDGVDFIDTLPFTVFANRRPSFWATPSSRS